MRVVEDGVVGAQRDVAHQGELGVHAGAVDAGDRRDVDVEDEALHDLGCVVDEVIVEGVGRQRLERVRGTTAAGVAAVEAGNPLVACSGQDQHLIVGILADIDEHPRPGIVDVGAVERGAVIGVEPHLDDTVAALHPDELRIFVAIVLERGARDEAHLFLALAGKGAFVSGVGHGGAPLNS